MTTMTNGLKMAVYGCLLVTVLHRSFAESNSVSDTLDSVQSWIKEKGRSYGGGGGYDGHNTYGGHHGGGGYYDDDDDKSFKKECLVGLLVTGVVVLGGLALFGTVLLPLLMTILGPLFGNVTPTVIPTMIPGRRRRNLEDAIAGTGAKSDMIKYTPEFLSRLDEAFEKFNVPEHCRITFVCSAFRDNLTGSLGPHQNTFDDLIRFDLTEVDESQRIHEFQQAALDGATVATCKQEDEPLTCDRVLSKIKTS
ncbi:Uncharacterised protein g9008 [Pycnogonum litorale]